MADNMATDQARLAVDTRAFPLLVYDPRNGDTVQERLSLQGNPAVGEDWWTNPKSGEQVNFIDFARSEGRFSKQFDKDGKPSDVLLRAKQDRVENWRLLQELAGTLGQGSKKKKAPAAASNGNGQTTPLRVGDRIRYKDASGWVDGVVDSLEPACLSLSDDTEIRVASDVLKQAVAAGIVCRA